MSQRELFVYGMILLAIVLFAARMWIINVPEAVVFSPQYVNSEQLPVDVERLIELSADRPGWVAVAKGPVRIKAEGTIDIGGRLTVPDDEKRPGDPNALVPHLPYGMLVGKVGEKGQAFKIGRFAQVAAKETVYLAINDSDYSDNSGIYKITLTGGTKY